MSAKPSFFLSRENLLYLLAAAVPIAFTAWMSLLNNFVVEVAHFDGEKIGLLQSLREVPGLLAFTIVFVLLIFRQQNAAYLSLIWHFCNGIFHHNNGTIYHNAYHVYWFSLHGNAPQLTLLTMD